jgi:NitT/TauT family transport system substrate-binding protein
MAITLIENFRAVFYTPFYAAFALRAYEAEGLDVRMKASVDAKETMNLLLTGAGEVSWGGPLRLMLAREKKPAQEPIVFCEVVGRDPFFLVGREPNPNFELAHLLDCTLGITTEVPTPWMCLQHDLRLKKLDVSRIRRAPDRTMAQNAEALRAGEVDVIQVFQPYAKALELPGDAHVWYAAATRGPTAYTTLNTTRAYAEKNPQTLAAMCRAMYRTQKWIAGHDGGALAEQVASYFPELPVSTLAACYDDYLKLQLWNKTPLMFREGLRWLNDAGLASGLMRERFEFEQVADMRFAEQAIRDNPAPL